MAELWVSQETREQCEQRKFALAAQLEEAVRQYHWRHTAKEIRKIEEQAEEDERRERFRKPARRQYAKRKTRKYTRRATRDEDLTRVLEQSIELMARRAINQKHDQQHAENPWFRLVNYTQKGMNGSQTRSEIFRRTSAPARCKNGQQSMVSAVALTATSHYESASR